MKKSKRIILKFIDGTSVPDSYIEKLGELVSVACEAEDKIGLDELENLQMKGETNERGTKC